MMKLVKSSDDEIPICPHCEQELHEVKMKNVNHKIFTVSEKFVYFCPHCHKVLGLSHAAYT